jgi:hypothetical protein
MNQGDWINTLTVIIATVPVIKMARDKRFSFFNISIVTIAIVILWIGCCKSRKDQKEIDKKDNLSRISDSTNKSDIAAVKNQLNTSNYLLTGLHKQIDSIGLGINDKGNISVFDIKTLKRFIFNSKTEINVTSNNQKGGQTAGSIINNK